MAQEPLPGDIADLIDQLTYVGKELSDLRSTDHQATIKHQRYQISSLQEELRQKSLEIEKLSHDFEAFYKKFMEARNDK